MSQHRKGGRKAPSPPRRCWPEGGWCPAGAAALCLVQAEDREMLRTGYLSHLLASNRAACEADDYCTYLRYDDAFSGLPPHWRKVFIATHVLNTTKCRAMAWLDSDAVLAGYPSELTALLRPSKDEWKNGGRPVPLQDRDGRYLWPQQASRPDGLVPHMVIAGDNDQYRTELSPFNAGVFILTNSQMSRNILAKWRSVWVEKAISHWRRNASHSGLASTEDGTGAITGHAWICEQRHPKTGELVRCSAHSNAPSPHPSGGA